MTKSKQEKESILEATDGEAVGLAVREPVDRRVARVQVPVPSIGGRLRGRPEDVARALGGERAIRSAEAGKRGIGHIIFCTEDERKFFIRWHSFPHLFRFPHGRWPGEELSSTQFPHIPLGILKIGETVLFLFLPTRGVYTEVLLFESECFRGVLSLKEVCFQTIYAGRKGGEGVLHRMGGKGKNQKTQDFKARGFQEGTTPRLSSE